MRTSLPISRPKSPRMGCQLPVVLSEEPVEGHIPAAVSSSGELRGLAVGPAAHLWTVTDDLLVPPPYLRTRALPTQFHQPCRGPHFARPSGTDPIGWEHDRRRVAMAKLVVRDLDALRAGGAVHEPLTLLPGPVPFRAPPS